MLPTQPTPVKVEESNAVPRRRRWLRRCAAVLLIVLLVVTFCIKDHVRTLASLRRVGDTNLYVMDYYVDYHGDELRTRGVNVQNLENSFLEIFFPDVILPIATRVKNRYVPESIRVVPEKSHHCSTLFLEAADGNRYYGKNHDYNHDATLVLRIQNDGGIASISIIDLAYLNLNRDDLDQTNLLERIPLLFSPYFVLDGVNRHGLAVGVLSVREVDPPRISGRPKITHATLMRVLLDNARTTAEAMKILEEFDIYFDEVPQHAFICDATGDSRIVEYLNGEVRDTVVGEGWQVCTNREMAGHFDKEIDAQCGRYRTGSELAERLAGKATIQDANNAIRSMYVEGGTMWTSLFNLTTGEYSVTYRSSVDSAFRDQLIMKP
jgi:hypothetical protein